MLHRSPRFSVDCSLSRRTTAAAPLLLLLLPPLYRPALGRAGGSCNPPARPSASLCPSTMSLLPSLFAGRPARPPLDAPVFSREAVAASPAQVPVVAHDDHTTCVGAHESRGASLPRWGRRRPARFLILPPHACLAPPVPFQGLFLPPACHFLCINPCVPSPPSSRNTHTLFWLRVGACTVSVLCPRRAFARASTPLCCVRWHAGTIFFQRARFWATLTAS